MTSSTTASAATPANLLADHTLIADICDHCAAVVDYLAIPPDESCDLNESQAFGRQLILNMVAAAMRHAAALENHK